MTLNALMIHKYTHYTFQHYKRRKPREKVEEKKMEQFQFKAIISMEIYTETCCVTHDILCAYCKVTHGSFLCFKSKKDMKTQAQAQAHI